MSDGGRKDFENGLEQYNQGNYVFAYMSFMHAAQEGHAAAMNNISFLHYNGIGTEKSAEKAFFWMKQAAEQGFAASCYPLAAKYYNGDGVSKDIEQAWYWASKALEMNFENQDAKNLLNMIQKERDEAANRMLNDKNGNRAFMLALNHQNRKEYEMAVQYYFEAAQKGNAKAMNNLSVCYSNGLGVEANKETSFYWMKQAAENNFEGAYYTLAVKYFKGMGVEKNLEQAKYWAEKVSEKNQSFQNAQLLLKDINALLSPDNKGKHKYTPEEMLQTALSYYKQNDAQRAFEWMLESAKGGNLVAMSNLNNFYTNGYGTEKNLEKAFEWTKAAAEGGNPTATYAIAYKYYMGVGTAKNLEQAEYWANKASKNQNAFTADAKKILESINKTKQNNRNQSVKYYHPTVINDFEEGQRLYEQQNYGEALIYLERAGKKGYAQALRMIGEAYLDGKGVEKSIMNAQLFLDAAAFRGDTYAQKLIACKIINSDGAAIWKAYTKEQNMPSTEKAYWDAITSERNKPVGEFAPFDEAEAMQLAAEYWKKYLHNPNQRWKEHNNTFPIVTGATRYMGKAIRYGNLDAVCAYADHVRTYNDDSREMYISYHRLAAYCGHSYAMFSVAKYYDSIDRNVANECYKQAARWNYAHAIRVCNERGLEY